MKFHHLYRKSELPNKSVVSDFAPEVAKYPKSTPNSQISGVCKPTVSVS